MRRTSLRVPRRAAPSRRAEPLGRRAEALLHVAPCRAAATPRRCHAAALRHPAPRRRVAEPPRCAVRTPRGLFAARATAARVPAPRGGVWPHRDCDRGLDNFLVVTTNARHARAHATRQRRAACAAPCRTVRTPRVSYVVRRGRLRARAAGRGAALFGLQRARRTTSNAFTPPPRSRLMIDVAKHSMSGPHAVRPAGTPCAARRGGDGERGAWCVAMLSRRCGEGIARDFPRRASRILRAAERTPRTPRTPHRPLERACERPSHGRLERAECSSGPVATARTRPRSARGSMPSGVTRQLSYLLMII